MVDGWETKTSMYSMLWHRKVIFKSKGNELSSSTECRIWTQGLRHLIASRLNAHWQTDWAIEDQAKKTWTRQPVPRISEHSAHSTPLPVGFRTWLWWYTCLLLLISMLWHRRAIFVSKGDKLSSSAECRIRTQRVSGTESPADWMPTDIPTELSPTGIELTTSRLRQLRQLPVAQYVRFMPLKLCQKTQSQLYARGCTG